MPVARIPLIGSLITRNGNASAFNTSDQRFTNVYPEVDINRLTGKSRAYLYKRLGNTSTAGNISSGFLPTNGSCIWYGNTVTTSAFSFGDGTNSTCYIVNHVGTLIGGAVSSTRRVEQLTDTLISGTANLVAITASPNPTALEGWFFPLGGAWTKITTNFPANVRGGAAHMDGYMFVIDVFGKIWNSDLNSLSSWTVSNFVSAQSMSDGGVGLARYKNMIVAFGTYSMEFFYNAGNATGSPLLPAPNLAKRIGAYLQSTTIGGATTYRRPIFTIGDTVYWIGRDAETSLLGFYKLNGFEPQKISTPGIDKLLNDTAKHSPPDATYILDIQGSVVMHAQTHVLVAIGSRTYAYCIQTGVWWECDLSPQTAIGPYFTDGGTSAVIAVAGSSYLDYAGNAVLATIRTELLDFGTDRKKYWKRLRVIGDTQTSTSNLNISFSDDDFQTSSAARTLDMNSATEMAQGLSRWGASRRRSWYITHSANTPMRLEAIEIEYELGKS